MVVGDWGYVYVDVAIYVGAVAILVAIYWLTRGYGGEIDKASGDSEIIDIPQDTSIPQLAALLKYVKASLFSMATILTVGTLIFINFLFAVGLSDASPYWYVESWGDDRSVGNGGSLYMVSISSMEGIDPEVIPGDLDSYVPLAYIWIYRSGDPIVVKIQNKTLARVHEAIIIQCMEDKDLYLENLTREPGSPLAGLCRLENPLIAIPTDSYAENSRFKAMLYHSNLSVATDMGVGDFSLAQYIYSLIGIGGLSPQFLLPIAGGPPPIILSPYTGVKELFTDRLGDPNIVVLLYVGSPAKVELLSLLEVFGGLSDRIVVFDGDRYIYLVKSIDYRYISAIAGVHIALVSITFVLSNMATYRLRESIGQALMLSGARYWMVYDGPVVMALMLQAALYLLSLLAVLGIATYSMESALGYSILYIEALLATPSMAASYIHLKRSGPRRVLAGYTATEYVDGSSYIDRVALHTGIGLERVVESLRSALYTDEFVRATLYRVRYIDGSIALIEASVVSRTELGLGCRVEIHLRGLDSHIDLVARVDPWSLEDLPSESLRGFAYIVISRIRGSLARYTLSR